MIKTWIPQLKRNNFSHIAYLRTRYEYFFFFQVTLLVRYLYLNVAKREVIL